MLKNGKLHPEKLSELRNAINDGLTDIENEPLLKKEEALKIAQAKGAKKLTKDKLTYFVEQGLVAPKIIQGDRNTHLFGREQISSIILIQRLKEEGLTYAQISSLLLAEQNNSSRESISARSAGEKLVLPEQGKRAQTILYSRIIAVLLNHLLGSALKPGFIILLRERSIQSNSSIPKGYARITQHYMDLIEAENYIGLIRPDQDLTAYVTEEPDREIIFHQFLSVSIADFKKVHWYLISVKIGNPLRQYDLMAGADQKEAIQNIHISNDSFEANIIGTLLRVMFLKQPYQKATENIISANELDTSTMLYSLVNIIPDISELWEYCAILTSSSENPNYLKISAMSRDFPMDVRDDIQKILIEPGRLMSGWTFQTTYPLVIQRTTGSTDPRLFYQNKENATAAIALPTRASDHFNGVMYIGTRYPIADNDPAFSDAEVRVLQIIADVVGEVIERTRITRIFETRSSNVISLPVLSKSDWTILNERLGNILDKLEASSAPHKEDDNLHLTIIKIESHQEVFHKNPAVSGWLTRHILETTRTFFIRNNLGNPEIYLHNTDLSFEQVAEFVCLIPEIKITDDRDRELRKKLRDLLSSLKLTFSYDEALLVQTHVWSMPFRFRDLKSRMANIGNETRAKLVAEGIMSDIEDALLIIPYIEKAHHFEEAGAYSQALELYYAAVVLAPYNRYLQRHIAKTSAAIGDLKTSISYWEKILQVEAHPSHYLRYAHTLARMGNYTQAYENLDKALLLDPKNQKIIIEWADLLAIEGKADKAIEKYDDALRLEIPNRDLIWLRLAEAYFEALDEDKALSFVKLVLDRLPDDQEAGRLMLKILRKKRS